MRNAILHLQMKITVRQLGAKKSLRMPDINISAPDIQQKVDMSHYQ